MHRTLEEKAIDARLVAEAASLLTVSVPSASSEAARDALNHPADGRVHEAAS